MLNETWVVTVFHTLGMNDTKGNPLPPVHLIDLVATNAKGQISRRRFEVYAGDVFLTDVGARFDEHRVAVVQHDVL